MRAFWSWVKTNRAELLADVLLISGLAVLATSGVVGTILAGGTLVYMGLWHGRLVK